MTPSYFSLKEKRVYLYGAASIGGIFLDSLKNSGIKVSGFIDKRSNEIKEYLGLPVYAIDDNAIKGEDINNSVIIISVKNVFEHTDIANELIKLGYYNIIYRPLPSINGIGNNEQNKIYKTYDYIESGEINTDYNIPKSVNIDIYTPQNQALIDQTDEHVIVLVSMNSIYTENRNRGQLWDNVSVYGLFPHIDLFHCVIGRENSNYDSYLEFCELSARDSGVEVTSRWRANVIKNRSNVFEHMITSAELEPEFFVRNAVSAKYNKCRGVFNLYSGKHRSVFFVASGRKYMPLKITKKEYESFINKRVLENFISYIKKNEITNIKAPIAHPYFYDYPCGSREFYYSLLRHIIYDLIKKEYESNHSTCLEGKNAYVLLDDYSYIEFALKNSGIKVKREDNSAITEIIGKLLNHKDKFDSNISEAYDYVIIDLGLINKIDDFAKKIKISDKGTRIYILDDNYRNDLESVIGEVFFCSIRNGKKTTCIFRQIFSSRDFDEMINDIRKIYL